MSSLSCQLVVGNHYVSTSEIFETRLLFRHVIIPNFSLFLFLSIYCIYFSPFPSPSPFLFYIMLFCHCCITMAFLYVSTSEEYDVEECSEKEATMRQL